MSEEHKRARSHAKGQVTRTTQALHRMLSLTLREFDFDAVARYDGQLDKADKADKAFKDAHRAHYDSDSSIPESTYFEEGEQHQLILDASHKLSSTLKTCISLRTLSTRVLVAMEDLQEELRDGYNPSLTKQFAGIEDQLDTFRDFYSMDSVADQNGVTEVRRKVMTLWHQVNQSRSDAGYDPTSSFSSTRPTHATSKTDPKPTALAPKLPKFGGKTTEFPTYKRLFLAILAHQPQLDDEERMAFLKDSMTTSHTQEQARLAIKQSKTFDEAMERFSRHYATRYRFSSSQLDSEDAHVGTESEGYSSWA